MQPLRSSVVADRWRKAKLNTKRRGKSCSQRYLDLLAWALFITNVPSAWLSPQQIMWHVELIFKLWKSQACLDEVGYYRLARILCQFYSRLFGLILFPRSVAPCRTIPDGEISLPKAIAVFQRFTLRFMDVMRLRGRGLAHLLQRVDDDFPCFAVKTSRRKSPSTL